MYRQIGGIYAEKPITQNVAMLLLTHKPRKWNKMTYHFNIKDYGMQGHLFKMVNIDLRKEINKIKDNPNAVQSIEAFYIDYESMLILITYHKKPNELYFFKSIRYGMQKYNELRKAIGIRIWKIVFTV